MEIWKTAQMFNNISHKTQGMIFFYFFNLLYRVILSSYSPTYHSWTRNAYKCETEKFQYISEYNCNRLFYHLERKLQQMTSWSLSNGASLAKLHVARFLFSVYQVMTLSWLFSTFFLLVPRCIRPFLADTKSRIACLKLHKGLGKIDIKDTDFVRYYC